MKRGLYRKLAWIGIGKNRRLYTPYILTCTGMVMMYYIVLFLSKSPLLDQMSGGGTISGMLGFGSWVIAVFALIFLFYTNSFLVRRRKKEFGLYNILGMGKRSIAGILCWETLMIAGIAFLAGSVSGIALSKLAELGLVNIIHGQVNYSVSVSFGALAQTFLMFAGIFLLIFLNTLRQIHASSPMALLRSENSGEKPPKANWILGISGVLLLAAAYYLAVTIKDPVTAFVMFFAAVLMVIAGTYLLFIAGSVVFCRALQKNKNYYYKPNHFVSVSSMVYRMRRNGAGLASICILGTMVLVMISSTACLYIGAEDSLRTRYPREITADICLNDTAHMRSENIDHLRAVITETAKKNGTGQINVMDYRTASCVGILKEGRLKTDISAVTDFDAETYGDICRVYMVPLEDYNRMTGTNEILDRDQVLLYSYRMEYESDSFAVEGGNTYKIKRIVDQFQLSGNPAMDMLPSVFVVLPDLEEGIKPLQAIEDSDGDNTLFLHWFYGFDTGIEDQKQQEVCEKIHEQIRSLSMDGRNGIYSYSCESAAANRGDFYGTFGGLFFLGLLLSLVFIAAAVLIIYYKQISEGYEDQSRFEIMQKVGMTKKDIRKSINSQLLTVFFLPLVMAGIHLAFAFPMVRKLLMLFNLVNLKLFILVTLISFFVFALCYTLVYRITSNAYYNIVSGVKEDLRV